MTARDPLELYAQLEAKVDAFFARVHEAHADAMACGKGCFDCCSDRLSITLLEAATLARAIAAMPSSARASLSEHARRADSSVCAALADDGSCMVYAARPLICRSHGVPIRYGRSVDDASADKVRLPVVTACFKNFGGGTALDALAAELILDQTTVSATLGALDAAFADQCDVPRGTRIDLAELISHPEDFFDV